MPILSVIVPVFNAEEYLEQCIESLLNGIFSDFELLLVDNCSTDRSREICEKYARRDGRVIVLEERQKGVSAARNCGIAAAKGKYIGFCDSDDYAEPELFATLLDLYDSKNVAMTACGIYTDMENGTPRPQNITGEDRSLNIEEAAVLAMGHDAFKGFLVNKLFRRSVIEENGLRLDPEIAYCEDLLFVLTYLSCAEGGVRYRSVPLYHYRLHGQNVSEKGYSDSMLTGVTAFEKIETLVQQNWPTACAEAKASTVGMAIYLLKAIGKTNAFPKETVERLGQIVRQKGKCYIFSPDVSGKSRMLCRLCRMSPALFLKVIHYFG